MAYEKQTWHTGDVITEGKLNHMEDGIANAGVLRFTFTVDTDTGVPTVDYTPQQIIEAFNHGQFIMGVRRIPGDLTNDGHMFLPRQVIWDNDEINFMAFASHTKFRYDSSIHATYEDLGFEKDSDEYVWYFDIPTYPPEE